MWVFYSIFSTGTKCYLSVIYLFMHYFTFIIDVAQYLKRFVLFPLINKVCLLRFHGDEFDLILHVHKTETSKN